MLKNSIKRLWAHISNRRKKQLVLLAAIMVISSLLEVISIGAVLPFLGALMSPEKLFESNHLRSLIATLEITDPNQLLLPLTLILIGAAAIAGLMRLILVWAHTSLGHSIGADLSSQIYEKTLYQPYSVHVSRNSSDVIAGISSKVDIVVANILVPLLTAISSLLILIGILAALLAIDPNVAIAAFFVFGSVYAVITIVSKKKLAFNSQQISKEHGRVIKSLQEGLGGIRDVLIDGTQAVYCKVYRSADLPLRRAQANNYVISASPRFLIEALGITLIASLAYVLAGREGGTVAAIPVLGALAIGAQRLLPVMQQLYSSWSSVLGAQASLNDVLALIEQPIPAHVTEGAREQIQFVRSIKFRKVSFRYSDQTDWVLQDLSLEIPRGAKVGFIGTTGSGKSTLLDILMALLEPRKGSLLIDEVPINQKTIRAWQSRIAHVPQAIFLADATIAENIAFGVPPNEIDYDLVKTSAEKAQIAKTIESWASGYNTTIGERGMRLSGGQRQRIGIARAFYKRADLMILDEATSALDSETESSVMEAINYLGQEITIVMVAHRLSTLSVCDTVYRLEGGQIKELLPGKKISQIE